MASVLEFLMPLAFILSLSSSHLRLSSKLTSKYLPRIFLSFLRLSIGSIPWLHNEPSNDSYAPRSFASSIDASIAK